MTEVGLVDNGLIGRLSVGARARACLELQQ